MRYITSVCVGRKVLRRVLSILPPTESEQAVLLAESGNPDAYIDICRKPEDVEEEPVFEDQL